MFKIILVSSALFISNAFAGTRGYDLKMDLSINGNRTIVSQPQILARENEKAEITIGKEGDKKTLSLSIVAQRKVL